MKKKVLAFMLILLLVALTAQSAFADPSPPVALPDGVIGSCNMGNSWWAPGSGPGNAGADAAEERGMFHVHNSLPHGESIGGSHMWSVTGAHCGE